VFTYEPRSREIETNGATIHVRVGGHGPAVVMLHGFGTTGDMWSHLASALIEDHMVVAPDLRGLGLSSKPDGGYDKTFLAQGKLQMPVLAFGGEAGRREDSSCRSRGAGRVGQGIRTL
jgi:pimeloyl-ACP methyl ester carboxylesterase